MNGRLRAIVASLLRPTEPRQLQSPDTHQSHRFFALDSGPILLHTEFHFAASSAAGSAKLMFARPPGSGVANLLTPLFSHKI